MDNKSRFVIDFNAAPIYVPVPTQKCFFLGFVKDSVQSADTIQLVQIMSIRLTEFTDIKIYDCTIECQPLDDKTGEAKGDVFQVFQKSASTGPWLPMYPPTFITAIDTWQQSPYEQLIHLIGLTNAKICDIQQNVLRLELKCNNPPRILKEKQ